MEEVITRESLQQSTLSQLQEIAKKLEIKSVRKYKKDELIEAILKQKESADKEQKQGEKPHPRIVMAHLESVPINVDIASPSAPVSDRAFPDIAAKEVKPSSQAPKEENEVETKVTEQSASVGVSVQDQAKPIAAPSTEHSRPAPQEELSGDKKNKAKHVSVLVAPKNAKHSSAKEAHKREGSVQEDLEQSFYQKGVFEFAPDNSYGFLRQKAFKFGRDDIYVSLSQIKKFTLRTGDLVSGYVRPPRNGERFPSLVKIEAINDRPPEESRKRPQFEDLVPIYPNKRLLLEDDPKDASTRLIDLFCPIGRGQRGIIVAKPKAGKTILLKKIATSIAHNHPDVELIALLVDERPEEVTDFERTIKGMVVSSTFDERPESHIEVSELVAEYSKRRVEQGKDVMILLDSLTRMARAYNLTCPASGKTLSGGLDPNALRGPKSFLGSARNIENGGSLTVIATALVETGSRLDDIIFEEFKGTANMEIHLSRELADKRIFPAIDIMKSGTRHEELLYNPEELDVVWKLRKMVADMDEAERMNRLITKLLQTKSNLELLYLIQKATE